MVDVTIDNSFIGEVYENLRVDAKMKESDKDNIHKLVFMVVDYGEARVTAETSKLRKDNEKLQEELTRVKAELSEVKAKRKRMMEEISAKMEEVV